MDFFDILNEILNIDFTFQTYHWPQSEVYWCFVVYNL